MHSRLRLRPTLGLLLLAAACASPPQRRVVTAQETPFPFVAWLVADACRREFAGADPLPYHAMAPATRTEDGGYTIRYERRTDGRWAAVATGRIGIDAENCDGELPRQVHFEPASHLAGWHSPDALFVVEVKESPRGIAIQCTAEGFDGDSIVRHLDRAAEFAARLHRDEDASVRPCCAFHAPWRAQCLQRIARTRARRGDLLGARDALQQARADAPQAQDLDLRIARLDQLLGQDELAAQRFAHASRVADDPRVRATAALDAQRAAKRMTRPDGQGLRDAALELLDRGRDAEASAMALAASTSDPDPIADLELRHRLLRARGDSRGSLGTALLLREYGAGARADRSLAEDFARVGQLALAGRAEARALVGRIPEPWLRAARERTRELALALRRGAESTGLAAPMR